MSISSPTPEVALEGVPISPGTSHGFAVILDHNEVEVPTYKVPEEESAVELERFEKALLDSREQIIKIRDEIARNLSEKEAQIFDSHLLVLEDPILLEDTVRTFKETNDNIESCFNRVSNGLISAFSEIEDEFIKERGMDVRDVSRRVFENLMGWNEDHDPTIGSSQILVANDLTPSEAARFERSGYVGLITEGGTQISHAAILARTLGIAAVGGLPGATAKIQSGDSLLLDGSSGYVYINPTRKRLAVHHREKLEHNRIQKIFDLSAGKPSVTRDGRRIHLRINIDRPHDIPMASAMGADGIGLFRTEGWYLRQRRFPTEEEQYQRYRKLAEMIAPNPVYIRSVDFGGDKTFQGFPRRKEENPFLGLRGIRFSLQHRAIFKTQLCAVLRAAVHGDVHLLHPMINDIGEIDESTKVLREAMCELRQRGEDFSESIPVGCMVETPCSALTLDLLAESCQFVCLGTNDLLQYLLAVDRVNAQVQHLYMPSQPAALRFIRQIVESARRTNLPLSVCGEMASDPIYAPFLLGLGVTDLSVAPLFLPEIKYLVQQITFTDAEKLAGEVLALRCSEAVLDRLRRFTRTYISTEMGKDAR